MHAFYMNVECVSYPVYQTRDTLLPNVKLIPMTLYDGLYLNVYYL